MLDERNYQRKLIGRIEKIFPDAMIYKMDPSYRQGTPDLLILDHDKWAMLEVKKSEKASHVGSHANNQNYWISKLDSMSYASKIYPENEEEVISELKDHFSEVRP